MKRVALVSSSLCGALLGVLCGGVSSSCNAFTASAIDDASTPSTNDAGDGGGVVSDSSSGVSEDGGDGASPGGPNILENGDFEDQVGGVGCGAPWGAKGYLSDLSQSADKHGGSYACMVCSAPDQASFTIDSGNLIDAHSGEVYELEAWVKLVNAATDDMLVDATIRISPPSGGPKLEDTYSAAVNLETTWQRIGVTHTVTKDGGKLNAYIGFSKTEGCAMIDDISIRRLK